MRLLPIFNPFSGLFPLPTSSNDTAHLPILSTFQYPKKDFPSSGSGQPVRSTIPFRVFNPFFGLFPLPTVPTMAQVEHAMAFQSLFRAFPSSNHDYRGRFWRSVGEFQSLFRAFPSSNLNRRKSGSDSASSAVSIPFSRVGINLKLKSFSIKNKITFTFLRKLRHPHSCISETPSYLLQFRLSPTVASLSLMSQLCVPYLTQPVSSPTRQRNWLSLSLRTLSTFHLQS
jgi:hypothetical protein